jgi:hypothetical protein
MQASRKTFHKLKEMTDSIIKHKSMSAKLRSALLYATSSALITIVNKITLGKFPSVIILVLAQQLFTLFCLSFAYTLGYLPDLKVTISDVLSILPLSLINVANAITGLYGTKTLSLPMFTLLRRTNILLTMALESVIFNSSYSSQLKLSVAIILFGSVIASLMDLQFNLAGYSVTFLSNVFTSSSNIIIKLKTSKLDNVTIIFLNSLIGIPFLLGYAYFSYSKQDEISDITPGFGLSFILSSSLGVVLHFSTMQCTKLNSALTTVMIGVLKNVVTSYVGMLDVFEYQFNWLNFIGINISMIGGISYSVTQFKEKELDLPISVGKLSS